MPEIRVSISAIAVAVRAAEQRKEFLVNWNKKWSRYHLVGGHREEAEPLPECLTRELGEELRLVAKTDFLIHEDSAKLVEFEAVSGRTRELTKYVTTLFDLTLTEAGAEKVAAIPAAIWVGIEDIRRGTTIDKKPISETTGFLLSRSGHLPPSPEHCQHD